MLQTASQDAQRLQTASQDVQRLQTASRETSKGLNLLPRTAKGLKLLPGTSKVHKFASRDVPGRPKCPNSIPGTSKVLKLASPGCPKCPNSIPGTSTVDTDDKHRPYPIPRTRPKLAPETFKKAPNPSPGDLDGIEKDLARSRDFRHAKAQISTRQSSLSTRLLADKGKPPPSTPFSLLRLASPSGDGRLGSAPFGISNKDSNPSSGRPIVPKSVLRTLKKGPKSVP
jgi:hypothetical protein